jgi:anaerobic magnesium-protoporphyrin IX monomethyl ester cyclase
MKILLAYISGTSDRDDPYINLLPTGLCYLHSCLREAGFDAVLANFSAWSDVAMGDQLADMRPDIVGISQWTHNRHASLDLARLVRRTIPASTVVMGGGHATFCYRDILREGTPVDVVVMGEGEETLLELAACRSAGKDWRHVKGIAFRDDGTLAVNPPRPSLGNLDRLPVPGRFHRRRSRTPSRIHPHRQGMSFCLPFLQFTRILEPAGPFSVAGTYR